MAAGVRRLAFGYDDVSLAGLDRRKKVADPLPKHGSKPEPPVLAISLAAANVATLLTIDKVAAMLAADEVATSTSLAIDRVLTLLAIYEVDVQHRSTINKVTALLAIEKYTRTVLNPYRLLSPLFSSAVDIHSHGLNPLTPR